MKKCIAKKHILFLLALLILAAIYIYFYDLVLYPIEKSNFSIKYRVMYIFLAIPTIYLSLSAIITYFIILWSKQPVPEFVAKYSLWLISAMLPAYIAIIFIHFLSNTEMYFFNNLLAFIVSYPILFIVPGVCLSIWLNFRK